MEINTEEKNLSETTELKFASLLLKLENYFHVPSTAIDEMLSELHYLIGYASVPSSNQVILDTFKSQHICIDQLITEELTSTSSSFMAVT